MKPIRTVAVFPTMFTLGNLVCGFFAIVAAARVELPTEPEAPPTIVRVTSDFDRTDENHNLLLCGWLIFLAMVFDALDGYVARLARAPTEFGAQLDSLADMVTFGVAPAFLLVKMCHRFTFLHVDRTIQPIWLIAATYAACVALRLARFNVEVDEEDEHLVFNGLPSPAGAGAIAGFAIMFYYLRLNDPRIPAAVEIDKIVQMALPVYGLILAVLMVSRIPYPHVVNQFFRGQRSFAHVVALMLGLLVVMAVREVAVPLVFFVFVVGPPVWHLWHRVRQRQAEREPLF